MSGGEGAGSHSDLVVIKGRVTNCHLVSFNGTPMPGVNIRITMVPTSGEYGPVGLRPRVQLTRDT